MPHGVQLKEEFRVSHTIEIVAEAEPEWQESNTDILRTLKQQSEIIEKQSKTIEELRNTIERMTKDNIDARKKAERISWIRMVLGAILGFLFREVYVFLRVLRGI